MLIIAIIAVIFGFFNEIILYTKIFDFKEINFL